MNDHEAVETRAMELYDGWNWGTGVPWVRRDEVLKQTYRDLARKELAAELPVVERVLL